MGKVSDLPNELLLYLFKMLFPEDRKMVVLVDRRWRTVGEDPVLWKWCIVSIKNGDDINKLSAGRFKHVEEIDVDTEFHWEAHQLKELFQASLELPKLKEIEPVGSQYLSITNSMDLRCVDSELLGRALGRLESLWIIGSDRTTNDQRLAILNEMSKKDCIEALRISEINLKTLELQAEVLWKIVSRLQWLRLDVSLTSDQALEIFKSVSENHQLYGVIFSLDLSSVDSEMFGRSIAKIDDVRFESMEISPCQIQALFIEMGQNRGTTKFNALEINLSAAKPKVIAGGLSKLEKIELCDNNLTDEQVQAIFTELKQNYKLKCLDLGYNNLSSVDAGDLASVIINVEVVDVTDTQLSTEQITAVLTRAQRSIKRLDIRRNHISEVDPAIVATAREIIEELYVDSESEDEGNDDESVSEFSSSEIDESLGEFSSSEIDESLGEFSSSEIDTESESDLPAIVPGPSNGTDAKSGTSKLTANQEMLDENSTLIKIISEYQNLGKHHEAMTYQRQLHRNLMYLAQLADANQNLAPLLPPPGQVPPTMDQQPGYGSPGQYGYGARPRQGYSGPDGYPGQGGSPRGYPSGGPPRPGYPGYYQPGPNGYPGPWPPYNYPQRGPGYPSNQPGNGSAPGSPETQGGPGYPASQPNSGPTPGSNATQGGGPGYPSSQPSSGAAPGPCATAPTPISNEESPATSAALPEKSSSPGATTGGDPPNLI